MSSFKHDYILINIDKPVYKYDFDSNNPLVLGDQAEIGLKSLFLWYTYPNISEKYNNDTLRMKRNGEWKDVKIPKGMYEVESLGRYLSNQVLTPDEVNDNKSYFRLGVNESTFKCLVKIARGTDIEIDFSKGELHKLLGLEPKIYSSNYEEGIGIINITRGVDKILIRCDVVDRIYQNNLRDVLYDVLPYAQPGAAIQERVDNVEYHRCKDKYIRHLEFKITDVHDQLLDFTEPVSIKIVFRHKTTLSI